MTKLTHLFQPYEFGFLTLPNRIVMGSMHTGLEERADGDSRMATFYARRASAGLIITGGIAPNLEGRVNEGAATLETGEHAKHHAVVTRAVHDAGGRIVMQILHTGRYAYHKKCVGASALQAPINAYKPTPLSAADVERTIGDFVRCARLAREAGYDGVEIMGSEGYLINQFIAPRTNVREDDWGGSFEARIRFPLEIVRRTRAAVGADFLIVFRISLMDLVENGSTWAEVVALAKAVQSAGADVLNSGIGWHEARVPTIAAMVPHGAYAFITGRLKKEVTLPLIAVNRINLPEVGERILAAGEADFVSMARPLLADPELALKAKRGDLASINTCIGCNQACLDHIFENKEATCLVNPAACREEEWEHPGGMHERLGATQGAKRTVRKVAVVGGGPAGLAAAATAADAGHQVTLFEASDKLGGQFLLAAAVPGKEDYKETVRYFSERISRAKADIRLGTTAGVDDLAHFDTVILATGVTPRVPPLEGLDGANVCFYDEILSGAKTAGARVAIVGAGGIGFDVAEFLTHPENETEESYFEKWGVDKTYAARGAVKAPSKEAWRSPRQVWLLQRKPGKPGETLGKTTGWIHKASLKNRGVEMLSGVGYEKVDAQGLHIQYKGEKLLLPADTIVVCAGQESVRDLLEPLKARGVDVCIVGGAHEAGELDAKRAIAQGVRAALDL
jgi:2,4-dienoyl-CoA reductase (NADPH2)